MLYRQGDLLLKEIPRVPKNAQSVKSMVLAEGEATGHKHKLVGGLVQVYEDDKNKFVEVEETTQLVHEEHTPIALDRGSYVVVREREFNPFADSKIFSVRQVAD